MRRNEVRLACSMLALLLVVMVPAVVVNTSHGAVSSSPELVATHVCACAAQASGSSSTPPELRMHGPPSQVNYDEQLGVTFAQSFTSLEYNVTAVAQTDPLLDTGPAYLLNGLSNNGYWYQVGVSWNWGPGETPGTGFDMNYEVFDPFGNSIYPINAGGLSAFSGTVNPGDTVVLNLYFGSSSQVVMIAEDLNTGANAQQVFSAEGGTYFTGLPDSVANSNGFFTGLMTEWYHGAPYYADLQGTVYTSYLAISSGWMWMDEFNPNSAQAVFAANATSPSSFTAAPDQLQEFAYNGTTEYASGLEFVTGALPNGTTTTTSTTSASATSMFLTLSYSVTGEGTGNGAPTLTYVAQGVQTEVSLTATPTTYGLDADSQWSVSSALPGSTTSERWVTNDTTSGTAMANQTITLQYQQQFNVTVGSDAANGGLVSPASSGWYDTGTGVTLTATPASGWAFEAWTIDGLSISPSSGTSVVVTVEQQINATAEFYVGLTITTPGSLSISYSYPVSQGGVPGAVQGTVNPGSTDEVYVPPSSTVTVEATPTSFLYSFVGWLGVQTTARTLVFSISLPSSLTAESGINYLGIGALMLGFALMVVLVLLLVVRRRRTTAPATVEPQTGTSDNGAQPQPESPPTGSQ